jgi:stage III sporulation protein AB
MVKLFGACCILFACTMFGFYQAAQLNRRPRQIRALVQALQRLESEIGYGMTPLPEALGAVSLSLPEPLSSMFRHASAEMYADTGRPASDCWEEAISTHWGRTSMTKGDGAIMMQLGYTLGATDSGDQIKHLRLAAGNLQAEETSAREDGKRFAGMWKSLGALSGALIVILIY